MKYIYYNFHCLSIGLDGVRDTWRDVGVVGGVWRGTVRTPHAAWWDEGGVK